MTQTLYVINNKEFMFNKIHNIKHASRLFVTPGHFAHHIPESLGLQTVSQEPHR